MKSKTKRSDKNLNKADKLSTSDRKLFHNPIFVDGPVPTLALSVHKKSRETGRSASVKLRDKRVLERKHNFVVKNNSTDTQDIRSGGTITNGSHQSQAKYKVSNDGADINVNASFVALEENSNETLNVSELSFALGNAVVLREDLSTRQGPMVNASIGEEGMSGKKNAAVLTDPECLGPCDPGSSVVLEGIVWNESKNGLLVVNVTWRGKTYVGTLMDSSNHHWGSPCFKDGSWNLEGREEDGEGRRLRRSRGTSQKVPKFLRSSDSSLQNGTTFPDESVSVPKEFACSIPNCSKRFKSLSGLKTHKCAALKESACVSCDGVSSCPNVDKSLQTNQKTSKLNGRSKQATLKRKSHFTDEHPSCNGSKSDISSSPFFQLNMKCKATFNDSHRRLKPTKEADSIRASKHANHGSNGDAAPTKNTSGRRCEKQKKSTKPQNNSQRKKKIKRISQVCNNSSDKSNAFSNEFESNILCKTIQSNGAIKGPEIASACKPSSDSCPIKDFGRDNLLYIFEKNRKIDNAVNSKQFFNDPKLQKSYRGSKYAASTCSSLSHFGTNCSKCSSPQPEMQGHEVPKAPISRPSMPSAASNPSSAPTAASSKQVSEDMYEVPLEANTASEVFDRESKHYKQVVPSSVEDFLFPRKQTT